MGEQSWFCEECKKRGSVQVEEHEGVWSVVRKLDASHRVASPDCTANVAERVRVNS